METKPSKVEKMKVKEIKIVKLQSGVWWRKGEGKRGKNIIKLEYISLFLLLYLIKCGVKWVPNKKYVCSIFFLLLSSVYVYWVLTNPIFRRSGLKFIIFSSTLNRFTYRLFFSLNWNDFFSLLFLFATGKCTNERREILAQTRRKGIKFL